MQIPSSELLSRWHNQLPVSNYDLLILERFFNTMALGCGALGSKLWLAEKYFVEVHREMLRAVEMRGLVAIRCSADAAAVSTKDTPFASSVSRLDTQD